VCVGFSPVLALSVKLDLTAVDNSGRGVRVDVISSKILDCNGLLNFCIELCEIGMLGTAGCSDNSTVLDRYVKFGFGGPI
jgi:hypothetical protein